MVQLQFPKIAKDGGSAERHLQIMPGGAGIPENSCHADLCEPGQEPLQQVVMSWSARADKGDLATYRGMFDVREPFSSDWAIRRIAIAPQKRVKSGRG